MKPIRSEETERFLAWVESEYGIEVRESCAGALREQPGRDPDHVLDEVTQRLHEQNTKDFWRMPFDA